MGYNVALFSTDSLFLNDKNCSNNLMLLMLLLLGTTLAVKLPNSIETQLLAGAPKTDILPEPKALKTDTSDPKLRSKLVLPLDTLVLNSPLTSNPSPVTSSPTQLTPPTISNQPIIAPSKTPVTLLSPPSITVATTPAATSVITPGPMVAPTPAVVSTSPKTPSVTSQPAPATSAPSPAVTASPMIV
jgi:hypothetical protein